MRVVLDTNVWVSGWLFRGAVRRVAEAAADGKVRPVSSPALIEELRNVIGRPRFHLPPSMAGLLIRQIEDACEIVVPKSTLRVVKADPADNRVLECAVAARVHGLVSGDGHLRRLKVYEGIPVWTPSVLMALLDRPD